MAGQVVFYDKGHHQHGFQSGIPLKASFFLESQFFVREYSGDLAGSGSILAVQRRVQDAVIQSNIYLTILADATMGKNTGLRD